MIINILTKLDKLDKKYSNYIHNLELGKNTEYFVYLCARLFNPDFIISYMFIFLCYKYFIHNDMFFVIIPLTHTIILLLITLLIKKITARPRPEINTNVKRLFNLRKFEKNCSMPSGDSLQCANFCIIMLVYFKIPHVFLILPWVMFARIFYFCHYILDTITGAILGIVLSYFIYGLIY